MSISLTLTHGSHSHPLAYAQSSAVAEAQLMHMRVGGGPIIRDCHICHATIGEQAVPLYVCLHPATSGLCGYCLCIKCAAVAERHYSTPRFCVRRPASREDTSVRTRPRADAYVLQSAIDPLALYEAVCETAADGGAFMRLSYGGWIPSAGVTYITAIGDGPPLLEGRAPTSAEELERQVLMPVLQAAVALHRGQQAAIDNFRRLHAPVLLIHLSTALEGAARARRVGNVCRALGEQQGIVDSWQGRVRSTGQHLTQCALPYNSAASPTDDEGRWATEWTAAVAAIHLLRMRDATGHPLIRGCGAPAVRCAAALTEWAAATAAEPLPRGRPVDAGAVDVVTALRGIAVAAASYLAGWWAWTVAGDAEARALGLSYAGRCAVILTRAVRDEVARMGDVAVRDALRHLQQGARRTVPLPAGLCRDSGLSARGVGVSACFAAVSAGAAAPGVARLQSIAALAPQRGGVARMAPPLFDLVTVPRMHVAAEVVRRDAFLLRWTGLRWAMVCAAAAGDGESCPQLRDSVLSVLAVLEGGAWGCEGGLLEDALQAAVSGPGAPDASILETAARALVSPLCTGSISDAGVQLLAAAATVVECVLMPDCAVLDSGVRTWAGSLNTLLPPLLRAAQSPCAGVPAAQGPMFRAVAAALAVANTPAGARALASTRGRPDGLYPPTGPACCSPEVAEASASSCARWLVGSLSTPAVLALCAKCARDASLLRLSEWGVMGSTYLLLPCAVCACRATPAVAVLPQGDHLRMARCVAARAREAVAATGGSGAMTRDQIAEALDAVCAVLLATFDCEAFPSEIIPCVVRRAVMACATAIADTQLGHPQCTPVAATGGVATARGLDGILLAHHLALMPGPLQSEFAAAVQGAGSPLRPRDGNSPTGAGAPADVERAGRDLFVLSLQQAHALVTQCRAGPKDLTMSHTGEDQFGDAAFSPLGASVGPLRAPEHSPDGFPMPATAASPVFSRQQWGDAAAVVDSASATSER